MVSDLQGYDIYGIRGYWGVFGLFGVVFVGKNGMGVFLKSPNMGNTLHYSVF